jgi:cytoskeletal protein RodZ
VIRRMIRIVVVLGALGGLGFALAKLVQGRRTTQARLPSGDETVVPKRSETPLVEPRMLRNLNLKSPGETPSAPEPTRRTVGAQAPPASAGARSTVATPAPTPAPTPTPTPTPETAPAAEPAPAAPAAQPASAGPKLWVDPDGAICPTSHPVKAKMASGIFHLPGMTAYERTTPDRCYADEAAAEADGLRKAKR